MLLRLWRLLEPSERRRVFGIAPLLVFSAFVEVVGVAAVIPFLSLLANPDSAASLPIVGPWLSDTGMEPTVLLRWAGVSLAVVLMAANALIMFTIWWLSRISWSLNHSVSTRLVRHYLAQPYAYILTQNTAALANRVIVEVRQLVISGVQGALEFVTRSVVIVALAAFLVVLNPSIAVIAFVSLGGAYGGIYWFTRTYLRRIGQEAVETGADRLKAVNEALGGFKDLRVAGQESAASQRYVEPSRRFGEVQAAAEAISRLPRYALEAVAVGGLVLIASFLLGRDGGFVDTLPLLGAYAFAGMRMLPAMQVLFNAVTRLRFALGALDAIEGDMNLLAGLEPVEDVAPKPLPFRDSVELRNVTFSYVGDEGPVLEDVTISVRRRSSLAIVGRTGSGKTTLVDVLLGLLEPETGTILVDGVAVTPERRRSFRRLFGYVPQSIFLLDDSVARNVAFGQAEEEVDLGAVRGACRQAQVDDFIENELPDGYATIVGERGVRLSGGQRQRIGIARALYHQPDILVFDEATSALDVHTEALVYRALDDIARERTVVTIAHRLDTVRAADHVVVLDHGRVIDEGPPDGVLARYGKTMGLAPRS